MSDFYTPGPKKNILEPAAIKKGRKKKHRQEYFGQLWVGKNDNFFQIYKIFCKCELIDVIHAPPTPLILYAAPITEHYRSSIKDYQS